MCSAGNQRSTLRRVLDDRTGIILGDYLRHVLLSKLSSSYQDGTLAHASRETRRSDATHPVLTDCLGVFGSRPAGCRRRDSDEGLNEDQQMLTEHFQRCYT